MKTYELKPTDSHKSFYGKAIVKVMPDGSEILQSYQTDVIKRTPSGELKRLWSGWSATTGRHIRSFCGISKKEWDALN